MIEQITYKVIIPALAALATGFAGWFFGRRRKKAEADSLVIKNMENIIEMWRKTAEDFNTQYTVISGEMKELREENLKLRKEVDELTKEVSRLKRDNSKLKKELDCISKNQERNEAN